jgi:hypothetical protein
VARSGTADNRSPYYDYRTYRGETRDPAELKEAVMGKGSEKPKKIAKKQPQKTLKERRAEKRSKPKPA